MPRPSCTTLFYLQLAPIDCLMAADCNKPIWSLHLNSKCEISSLAKRRRRRRRPFALAPSGGVHSSHLGVCVCPFCVNVPSRKCQLLRLCPLFHLQLVRRPRAALRTEASIGIAMFVLVVLIVVCSLVHLFNLSLCNFYAY